MTCNICGDESPAEVCDRCSERRKHAANLLSAHPEVSHRLGSPVVAQLRLDHALDALAAAGVVVTLEDANDIESVMSHLATLGRVLDSGEPWDSLNPGLRNTLADAVAGWLAERVAMVKPPVSIPPPPVMPNGTPALPACVFCGVSALAVDAWRVLRLGGVQQAAQALWEPVNPTVEALGGRRGSVRVSGFLCPVCAKVRGNAGSIGAETMRKAAVAAGVVLPPGESPIGWAATGDPPGVPWGHLFLVE